MVNRILALCDEEKTYLYHLAEYLERKETLSFTVHVFTDYGQLGRFLENNEIEVLLIAERVFREELLLLPVRQILILNESGITAGSGIQNISKYQSRENIFRALMNHYMGGTEEVPRRVAREGRMKLIGCYTPIGRCLQTTFALSMGQLLAGKSRVLYLNLEGCSGMNYLLPKECSSDITDVLYFFGCEREKLAFRMAGIVQALNGMDYIPPARFWKDLQSISGEQWIQLFREIEEITDYEYLILDLSDQVNGLLEILKGCFRIFTITRQEEHAEAKLKQYESVVQSMNCEEIAFRTSRQNLPMFEKVPSDPTQLIRGEIAAYVRKVIEEEIYGYSKG